MEFVEGEEEFGGGVDESLRQLSNEFEQAMRR